MRKHLIRAIVPAAGLAAAALTVTAACARDIVKALKDLGTYDGD